jgi:ribosome-associated protein
MLYLLIRKSSEVIIDSLIITDTLQIPLREIDFNFVRSSGPGGQNVNKVATACQLRFDVYTSLSLPPDIRERLIQNAGNRINREGVLVIDARRHRTRERNRQDALHRLAKLIQEAVIPPTPRKATRPPFSSKRNRLDAKRQQSQKKQLRGKVDDQDD